MSIEKQRLYNEIDTLPEELTNQVINFIEYLKISYVDTDAPDNIMIKSKKDLESILKYLRYNLAGDIIADKYKLSFKQELKNLEDIAGSMPILSQELTGYKNIRKVNVRNYVIFYITDEENAKAFVLRIDHAFMDWEKCLKDE